jgi:hypothetical protein
MKLKREKSEITGSSWQILILSKYEAQVLAAESENLAKMANGEYQGTCIGGANIELKLEKS